MGFFYGLVFAKVFQDKCLVACEIQGALLQHEKVPMGARIIII